MKKLIVLLLLVAGCQSGDPKPLRADPLPEVPPVVATERDEQLLSDAIDFVVTSGKSEDPQFRANAAEAAESLPTSTATELLVPMLQDEDPVVRFTAMMAIGRQRLGGQQLWGPLADLVRGPSPNGRVAAMFALHRLGNTSFSQGLANSTKSTDPVVRSHAALALGLTGAPSAARVLEPMLADPDATTRLTAAEALWRLGDQDGRDRLMEASLSGFSDDSVIGTLALGVHPDPAVFAMLMGKLTDDYDEVQLAAARALGMLGSDAGFGLARGFTASEVPRQRGMAAAAMGSIGRADAQPDLARLLYNDEDPNVQLAAAAAILELDDAGARP